MARTEITTFNSASSRGLALPAATAAFVDGHSFTNNGKRFLIIENSNAATRDITALNPAVVDVNLDVPNRSVTVGATTGRAVLGPFGPEYNQADGKVYIDYTATAGVSVYFCELASS